MKSNIEILSEIFEPTSFDCKTEIEDLQITITLNSDLKKILRAMELAQEQVKLCNIPHVSGLLACPNCRTELQLEVKEMTNIDLLNALKANNR